MGKAVMAVLLTVLLMSYIITRIKKNIYVESFIDITACGVRV